MSSRVLRQPRDPLDLLERILNKTSLTTKRVTHSHIIEIGEGIVEKTHVDVDGMLKGAVNEALESAERRHTRELKAVIHRAQKEAEEEKEKALSRQQIHFQELAKRVALQRSKAEKEKIRELTKKFEKEKEEALNQQWEECERLKEIAVQEACALLSKKLRDEFAWEREKAVADALAVAREKFKKRELETIERTKQECERLAAEEAARVAQCHAEEIAKLEHRYKILNTKYHRELLHKQNVEKDFMELQTDYMRFMDYTDGKYSSDYMMHLRNHGMELANKRLSIVTYEDLEELPQ